jgi:hypothetical protein
VVFYAPLSVVLCVYGSVRTKPSLALKDINFGSSSFHCELIEDRSYQLQMLSQATGLHGCNECTAVVS